jgi:hypothetical protein
MGSAARRRGAYGREYLRAGLRLHARGGRRLGKRTSQTRAKGYRQKDTAVAAEAENNFSITDPVWCPSFYSRQTCCPSWSAIPQPILSPTRSKIDRIDLPPGAAERTGRWPANARVADRPRGLIGRVGAQGAILAAQVSGRAVSRPDGPGERDPANTAQRARPNRCGPGGRALARERGCRPSASAFPFFSFFLPFLFSILSRWATKLAR